MAKAKADSSIVLGIVSGFGGIMLGYLLEHGNPLSLLGVSAFIIIVGGLSGAMITSFSLKEYLQMPKIIKESMKAPAKPDHDFLDTMMALSEKARKEGLLSLEESVEEIEDPFFKKGLRLVIDGVDQTVIEEVLEGEISVFESHEKQKSAMFEAAGGFCPTMGIIGTCTGLVIVLSNLGGDPSELGHSIAAAFLATLYGISFANLIFLPIANHIKNNTKTAVKYREALLVAILSLQKGDGSATFESKVSTYIE